MSLRVVLFAEGSGELLGGIRFGRPRPGESILEDEYGAGHILVQRALGRARGLPESAIHFEVPPKYRGREARGSDLLRRETLRRLTIWPSASARPQLIVLLVDRDGQKSRLDILRQHLADHPVPHVIAVAIEEFEAWLLADPKAVKTVMGASLQLPGLPEKLEPRQAKELLMDGCSKRGDREHARSLRCNLARTCDLDVVAGRCSAFDSFLDELKPGHAP